jgi:hypothetical protein
MAKALPFGNEIKKTAPTDRPFYLALDFGLYCSTSAYRGF